MLFLVTMRHTPAECPGRDPQQRQAMLDIFERREERKRELGLAVHQYVIATEQHTSWAVIETDDLGAIRAWTRDRPGATEVTITPVERMADVIVGASK